MARKIRQLHPDFPMHITARTNNREKFPIPISDVWNILEDYNYFISTAFDIKIHSFVLMPNHFHMMASDPGGNLSSAMGYYLCQSSKEIGRLSNRINRIWGARFHTSVIRSPIYYFHAYKYVYRNPVKAGLCDLVTDYPFGTLKILLGQQQGTTPLIDDDTLFSDVSGTLNWLNEGYKEEEQDVIRKALKRKVFELAPCPTTRSKHPLESWNSLPERMHGHEL